MHTAFLTDTILDKKLEDLRFGRKSKFRSLMRGHLFLDLGAISRWPLLEGAIEGHPGAPRMWCGGAQNFLLPLGWHGGGIASGLSTCKVEHEI